MIHHNQFYSFATNHCTTGVRFIGTADGVVSDNIFGSMDNGIWFDHTAGEGAVQRHNVFQGTFTNQFLDQR
jgi:hydroxyethylthiazole kinase-like sugar kinase family protein